MTIKDIMPVLSMYGIGVALVLIIGMYCVLTTRNLLRALIGMEVLIKAVTLLIIVAGNVAGQVALAQAMVITLITIEVALIVVAVGVVLCVHRCHNSIETSTVKQIKG
jgi:NADH-quinone oxidoreductase subunit K